MTTFQCPIETLKMIWLEVYQYILLLGIVHYYLVVNDTQVFILPLPKEIEYFHHSSNEDVEVHWANAIVLRPVGNGWVIRYHYIGDEIEEEDEDDLSVIEPRYNQSVPFMDRYIHIFGESIINQLKKFFQNENIC